MSMNRYRTFVASLILAGSLPALLLSCKKSNTPDPVPCQLSVSAMTGTYQLIKAEKVAFAGGAATDITSSLSACELNAEYQFNAGGSALYTETSPCTGSGSGTWRIEDSKLIVDYTSGNGARINSTTVVSWDCSQLVLITSTPSTLYNYRYTLRKIVH